MWVYPDYKGKMRYRLAKRCGIPQSSIARIETLKTVPRLDTLVKVLQALELTLQVPAAG